MTLMKDILRKSLALSFVIVLLYINAVLRPGVYMKFWYCVIWSVIALIGILKWDPVNMRSTLKPAYQLIIALTLILITIIETIELRLRNGTLFNGVLPLLLRFSIMEAFDGYCTPYSHV